MFEELAAVPAGADEAGLRARLEELEAAKSAAAAGQARVTAALDRMRRAAEAAAGVPTAKRGRGLAAEIALARRDSPNRGGRHLGFARALAHEMPRTLRALECGALSEWRATLIVRESACLSIAARATLDAEPCGDVRQLAGKGDKRITAAAKQIAYRLDPQAVVDRAAKAAGERTVTIRPAPDTMTYVTALLPVAQGVGVYAALKKAADTAVDGRSRGQVMADTLVERITGTPADVAAPVAVQLVISDQTLLGGDETPAHLQGYGPIPAAVGRGLVNAAVCDKRSKATLRRLYRHPRSNALVAMESRSRCFPKALATFIDLRDQTCRTPYCDAPIRHHDHAHPYYKGGPTNAVNGLGECAACNYAKEADGWQVTTAERDRIHGAAFTTPPPAPPTAAPHPHPRALSRSTTATSNSTSASPSPKPPRAASRCRRPTRRRADMRRRTTAPWRPRTPRCSSAQRLPPGV